MRLAVIDCGTNTFNLLIVEVLPDSTRRKLYSTRVSVRLGAGSPQKDHISDEAFARGMDAVSSFMGEIRRFEVAHIIAIATSAIREAVNGQEFVMQIAQHLNLKVNVIDGHREAELIYLGVREAVKLTGKVSLIMDIGGGSTEFILANNKQIFWKQSFKIGVARLLAEFDPSDPITPEEIEKINNYLIKRLQPLIKAVHEFPPHELIGSSGAFESIIEMIHGEFGGEALCEGKTEYEVRLADNARISELIIASTLEQRKKVRGLVPMRFDMIVMSCLNVNLILDIFKLNTLRVSTYSVKEGALMDYLNKLN